MAFSTNMAEKSQKLVSLAQQLRLYKHSYPSNDNSTKQQQNEVSDDEKLEPARSNNRAAVLVCIFEGKDGDLRVILTKRSSTLSSYSGEVSLPGGKREDGDADDIMTALREAKEEIGLDPSLVDIVAVLEPFVTLRGMAVTPVVGILYNKKAFNPFPNTNEVESIFDVPLEMFLKDENRRAEKKQRMGQHYLLHFFDYQSEREMYVIWALTAGIMIKVASIVYQRPPEFFEQRPPFWDGVSRSDGDITKL